MSLERVRTSVPKPTDCIDGGIGACKPLLYGGNPYHRVATQDRLQFYNERLRLPTNSSLLRCDRGALVRSCTVSARNGSLASPRLNSIVTDSPAGLGNADLAAPLQGCEVLFDAAQIPLLAKRRTYALDMRIDRRSRKSAEHPVERDSEPLVPVLLVTEVGFRVLDLAMVLDHHVRVELGESIASPVPDVGRIGTDAVTKGATLFRQSCLCRVQ